MDCAHGAAIGTGASVLSAAERGAVVAVTLQGADKGDTTTFRETLVEAGMMVAELLVRDAKLHPDDGLRGESGRIGFLGTATPRWLPNI